MVGEQANGLPAWATLLRAPNPGPMTLEGTNTWVLRAPGADRCVVVDPGPLDEAHLEAITAHAPVGLILITHGHPDHVDGLARTVELLGGVDVLAASPAFRRGGPTPEVDGLLITDIATPGHTTDSLCFLVEHGGRQVVLTGDTILGRGTAVVAWPDGNLGEYLTSLGLLTAYQSIPALPGHGPVLPDCGVAAESYLEHRKMRLDQVRAALAAGDTTAEEVVERVYADVDRAVWWAATLTVRAQLEYLSRESQQPGNGLDPP